MNEDDLIGMYLDVRNDLMESFLNEIICELSESKGGDFDDVNLNWIGEEFDHYEYVMNNLFWLRRWSKFQSKRIYELSVGGVLMN